MSEISYDVEDINVVTVTGASRQVDRHFCTKPCSVSTTSEMHRSGSQSDRLVAGGGGTTFIAKSSASEHSMSTGVSGNSSGGSLPRTLSTSVLRIKNRSTFWDKFWDERTRRDA